jgi:hypothetical protein
MSVSGSVGIKSSMRLNFFIPLQHLSTSVFQDLRGDVAWFLSPSPVLNPWSKRIHDNTHMCRMTINRAYDMDSSSAFCLSSAKVSASLQYEAVELEYSSGSTSFCVFRLLEVICRVALCSKCFVSKIFATLVRNFCSNEN